MEYPPDFPEHLQSKVDEVIAAAEVSFIDAKAKRSNAVYEDSLFSYIETVFFGFAQQCVEAGEKVTGPGSAFGGLSGNSWTWL